MASIASNFKDLPEDFIVLALLPARNFNELNLGLLKALVNLGHGCYVSINRPYKNITLLMRKVKADSRRLHFIDCITEQHHKVRNNNCSFILSPDKTKKIHRTLSHMIKMPHNEFVYLDSLDTLSLYNSDESIEKFINKLADDLRDHKVKGIFVACIEDIDKSLLSRMEKVFDKIITLN